MTLSGTWWFEKKKEGECEYIEHRRKKTVKERAFASYIFKFDNKDLYVNGAFFSISLFITIIVN